MALPIEREDLLLFDKRLVERNIRAGLTTRANYRDFVGGLGDKEAQADEVPVDEALLSAAVRTGELKIRAAAEAVDTGED